ncbi:hypothetical protein PSA7680_03535 [Pseudoruegeria aquimaris]|uniref:Pyridoxal phosphate homeostasis protein n=1 Tax=Pseudoruegeria aquimaris TaxID=393663 RepID=A0A1Y5TPP8_9RHOB|nr:YggS family pyridoxal phosphate-dependent enzyme [Pseudoruegeria aquimaris]SLN66803.1 hypothetical protein PSA7680_03535 [Pseudoruegeria aquimaris]
MSLQEIIEKIHAEEKRAGRPVGATRLIAVSKVQPLERIEQVLEAGHQLFGENRVQEAAGKWPELKARFPGVELHLLGPLQTNKVRQAFGLFDAIHSVDRPKLAKTIARIAEEEGHCPELFVQVNTGEEPQKAGVLPADADAFIAECRGLGLKLAGLMCIPPADEEPSLHFMLLRKIAERNGIEGLSMGMSGDFERAVALGATHVRVGAAIFGERVAPQG